MTPTPGRPTASPACPRRAPTSGGVVAAEQPRRADPAGAVALDRMGAEQPVALDRAVGPFATVALDVADLLPDLRWPAQIELRAGRHVVRPRYEVTRAGRTRIAHVNVERDNLRPDPASRRCRRSWAAATCCRSRSCRARFRTIVQPTPMATTQANLPVRLDVFDPAGRKVAERFLGCLPRDHAVAVDIDDVAIDAATPNWSTIFATAARPTAGCTRCSVTRTGSPATSPSPASARISSTPR